MLIQLKNFGPISYFEFDTEKQMHFIFGENNIGKSYAISAVYLILKNMINTPLGTPFIAVPQWEPKLHHQVTLTKLVKGKVEQSNDLDIDIKSECIEILQNIFDFYFVQPMQQALLNTFNDFDKLKNEFSQINTQIILKFNSGNIFNLAFERNRLIVKSIHLQRAVNIRKTSKGHEGGVSIDNEKILIYENKRRYTTNHLNYIPYVILQRDFAQLFDKNIYFLPASRSGLYHFLSSFGAIIAKLSQSKGRITQKINLPDIAEQLSDYFLNLSNIKKDKKKDDFSEIAQFIEQKVLKGQVYSDFGSKKFYFQPEKTNISLELSNASSMISEVAPLVAHLKYIISDEEQEVINQNILFIEEPEAHLHPKIQVELMEIFALLAQKGLKIVMTSHSNYLFNKLSNMILAKEIEPSTIRVAHMKLGEMGSYVDENSMQVDQDGIDDDNFSETAEALYLERMKL